MKRLEQNFGTNSRTIHRSWLSEKYYIGLNGDLVVNHEEVKMGQIDI